MNVSLLIPWRSDGPDGHRQKLWDYLRPLWEKTDFEICVGEDDVYPPLPPIEEVCPHCIAGEEHEVHNPPLMTREPLPFSCSQALNRAAAKATGDVFVTMGADYFPLPHAVQRAATFARSYPPYWMPVFDSVAYVSEKNTNAMLQGKFTTSVNASLDVQDYGHLVDTVDAGCMGITAVKADVWRKVGGMDERYRGWGWEDTDLRRRLTALNTPHRPQFIFARGLALWHDSSHRDLTYNNPNRRLFEGTA